MTDRRTRVLVVAEARPAKGGVARFSELLIDDPGIAEQVDMTLLNTTRTAVRRGGAASVGNVANAIVDTWRVWRSGRHHDIVHIQAPFMPLLPLARAVALSTGARLSGAAVLCHVHTGLIDDTPGRPFCPSLPMRALLRSLRIADGLVVLSAAAERGLARHAPAVRLTTLPNAVDVSDIPQAEPRPPTPTIVYAGALGRGKGLLDLLEALIALRERGLAEWSLRIVGGANQIGEDEAEFIREAYGRAGFGETFLGALPVHEVHRELARATIVVLPSHSEGHPLVVLEAMAAGAAVIATAVGGVPETIRDGVDGVIVPPRSPERLADALTQLLGDPDLCRSLGSAARKRVEERFDLPVFREQLLALYQSALAWRAERVKVRGAGHRRRRGRAMARHGGARENG